MVLMKICKYFPTTGKAQTAENGYKVASLIFLLVGLAFLAAAALSTHKYFYLVQHGVRTTGTVMACVKQDKNVPSQRGPKYAFVVTYTDKCYQYSVEFNTNAGRKIDFLEGANDSRPFAISNKVIVLYLPDAPEQSAIIDYGPNVVLWCFGAFLTCLSALYYFKLF